MNTLKKLIKQYIREISEVSKYVRIISYHRYNDDPNKFHIDDIIECSDYFRKNGEFRTHFSDLIDGYFKDCNRIVVESPSSKNKLQLDY